MASRHLDSVEGLDAQGLSHAGSRAREVLLLLDVEDTATIRTLVVTTKSALFVVVRSRTHLASLRTAAILSNVAVSLTSVAELRRTKVFMHWVAGKAENHTLWDGAIVPTLQDNTFPGVFFCATTSDAVGV